MHIALLVDDPESLTVLMRALQPEAPAAEEISFTVFADSTELRLALLEQNFELLILDTFLSAHRLLAMLAWLRGTWKSSTPIIVLSERSGARDVAKALDAGANDYVIKPFRPLELRARAYRFRSPGNATRPRAERLGDWTFLHDRSSLIHAGFPSQTYDLNECEFNLALALFRRPGDVISRRDLLDATNQTDGATAARLLDNQIHRLRNNLGLDTKGVTLKAVYGQGYRLDVSQNQR